MPTVAEMTKEELREIIEIVVEEKPLELLGDPDEGLPIRKAIRERLLHQKSAVANGERGERLEEAIRRLGFQVCPGIGLRLAGRLPRCLRGSL